MKYVLTTMSLFLISACAVTVQHIPDINIKYIDSCYLRCYDNYRTSSNSMCIYRNSETGEWFNTRSECEKPK